MPTTVIILLCIFMSILLLLIIASLYFFNVGFARKPPEYVVKSPDLTAEEFVDLATPNLAWLEAQPLEDIEIKSYDGLLLHGYYLPASVPTTRTAVLAHGYAGGAMRDVLSFARMYHERFGFNILMADDRAHGQSEGKYIGFGWPDRLDYVKWIHYALKRVGQDAQIVLHGISMGGATVLMVSGEKLPEQVKCIVSDCAYTSVNDILTHQAKRMYKLPPFPLLPLTSLVCKLRAGYFFGEASALQQLRKNTRPVLFIHGADDKFVPAEMMDHLYDVCTTYKEKLLVPGAGHGLAYKVDKDGYIRRVNEFVLQFVK